MIPMSANRSPDAIPLTAGDRVFLIPETDDLAGTHFPMSLVTCAALRRGVTAIEVAAALQEVERRFPQFRLGYRLDAAKDRLVRVPDTELSRYLSSLVVIMNYDLTLEEMLSECIHENNTPLAQPIRIGIFGAHIIIRMHHSFGDGKFLFHLMSVLLLALLKPEAFCQLPDLPNHYHLPMWRVVYQSPHQAWRVFSKWVKTLRGSVEEYQRDMSGAPATTLEPIKSGTAMHVRLKTLSPAHMAALERMRTSLSGTERISLNTLLQVLFAKHLNSLGLTSAPIVYTIPVDLHRYLNQPDAFYPGNLNSQLRITGKVPFDLASDAVVLQSQVSQQLEDLTPLATLPSEWLMMLAGRKTYKNLNRGWLNASINTDPRFFVLTNLGALDERFSALSDCLHLDEGIFLMVPLMGGPHVVISVNTLQGQGNIAITYDPRVLNDSHIDTLFEGLDNELAH